MIKNLVLTLSIGLLAQSAYAENLAGVYEITGYPIERGNCHTLADDLGSRFSEVTGIEIESARCLDQTNTGYDIEITFDEQSNVNLVTTAGRPFNINGRGFYETYEDCQDALQGETEAFENSTELTAFDSYCIRSRYIDDIPWSIRIDGFGNPALVPVVKHLYFHGRLVTDDDTWLAEVKQSLLAADVQVRQMIYQNATSMGTLSFIYYAQQPVVLNLEEVVRYEDRNDHCSVALSEAQTLSEPGNLWFCANDRYSGHNRLYRLQLTSSLEKRVSVERYDSYETCQDARADAIAFYASRWEQDIKGAVCGIVPAGVFDDPYRLVFLLGN